jgi:GxxExxY protein
MAKVELLAADLTEKIIGAAMEVHRSLGPGYLESVYQAALGHEFHTRGIQFVEQGELDVHYKGKLVGRFRCDFIVENQVLVEIKATNTLSGADEAQLINYLRGTGVRVGLILNFGESRLRWKRRVWTKGTTS